MTGAAEPLPAAPRRIAKWKLLLLAILVATAGSAPWWGPQVMRRMAFFRVRRVEIVGARYLPPSDILRRLAVDTLASVWDDFAPLERRVAAHPEVRSVRIVRRLPGTLVVQVTEHLPAALVPAADGFRVYDARGVPLPIDPARTPVDAPILAQRDTAILRFLGELRDVAPAMYGKVSAVRRTAPGELLLYVATLQVRAGADLTVARLAEVDAVDQDLARRQLRAAELDLRYRDQVIARLP